MTLNLQIIEKLLLVLTLIASILGFWYFEPSAFLRIMVIVFGVIGIYLFFKKKSSEKIELSTSREFLIIIILYLGLYTFYNLLYGLAIPIYLIMILVLILSCLLFFTELSIDRVNKLLEKPVFYSFVVLTGLIVLESFLALSFWPIDPKVKSLIIVVVFWLNISLIYLYVHSMLRLKRVIGYLIASIIIVGGIILSTLFLKGQG